MSNLSILAGPYVVFFCRVLDFYFHHTSDYSSGGLSVQSVSELFFLFLFFFNDFATQ